MRRCFGVANVLGAKQNTLLFGGKTNVALNKSNKGCLKYDMMEVIFHFGAICGFEHFFLEKISMLSYFHFISVSKSFFLLNSFLFSF